MWQQISKSSIGMVDVRQAEQRKPDNTAEGHEDVRWLASIGRPIKVLRPYLNEDGGIAPNAAISSSISGARVSIDNRERRRTSSTRRQSADSPRPSDVDSASSLPRRDDRPVVPTTRSGKVGCLENVKETSPPSTCDRVHVHRERERERRSFDEVGHAFVRCVSIVL